MILYIALVCLLTATVLYQLAERNGDDDAS